MPDISETVGIGGPNDMTRPSAGGQSQQTGLDSSDAIGIREVSITPQVAPGEEIPISVEVTHSIPVALVDDDLCTAGFFQSGLSMGVRAVVDGTTIGSNTRCVSQTWGDYFSPKIAMTAQAPDQGGLFGPIEIILEGGNTGNELERVSAGTITVAEDSNGGIDCDALDGFHEDPDTGRCVPVDDDDRCSGDMVWDEDAQECVEPEDGDGLTAMELMAGAGLLVGTGALAYTVVTN